MLLGDAAVVQEMRTNMARICREAQYTTGSMLYVSPLTAPCVVLLGHKLLTCAAVLQDMRDEIAKQFTERPWYTSGSTLQVSRLTAPRVVLLGDAAHAVSAAFGQGVNAALEVSHWPYTHEALSDDVTIYTPSREAGIRNTMIWRNTHRICSTHQEGPHPRMCYLGVASGMTLQ